MDIQEIEIPVWIGGCQKWLTGLTKRTTCDDVIYSLLHHNKNDNDVTGVDDYAIYERWRDVEKPLRGRTKILKLWRTWGNECKNVKIYVRKLDSPLESSSEVIDCPRSRKAEPSNHDCDNRIRKEVRFSNHTHQNKHQKSRPSKTESKKDICKSDQNNVEHVSKKSKAFHQLVQLIIEQEKNIQEQLTRIKEVDRQIETHETKLHVSRMQKNGQNYLQEAYFRDRGDETSSTSSEELFSPVVKDHSMDMCVHMYENILDIQNKIHFEESKIEDLSVQCHDESIIVESADDHVTLEFDDVVSFEQIEEEMHGLRRQLQQCIDQSLTQQEHIRVVTDDLGECECQLDRKRQLINDLLSELHSSEYTDHQQIDSDLNSDLFSNTDSLEQHSPSIEHIKMKNRSLVSDDIKHDLYEPIDLKGKLLVPYLSYKVYPDNYSNMKTLDDSNSDTGLSSLHSDEAIPILETLV